MRLGSNITALTISTQMKKTNRYATNSSLRLSSGLKINSAKDDPAGMAIVNRLDTLNRQTEKNKENYSDGISLVQTLDSSVGAITDMLQRMRELSVQAATDTLTNSDREKIQVEIDQLKKEIEATGKNAQFNGIKYLSGDSTRLNYPTNPNLANYSYISGNVPEGNLNYTIVSMGTPAEVTFTEQTGSATVGVDGNIKINGYQIDISATDTLDDVNSMIKKACDATNIEYYPNKLITRGEGSDESIEIVCEPPTLLSAQFTQTSAVGKDAVISGVSLTDIKDGTAISSFNSGLVVKADGNDIKFSSTNNQVIEISLAFKLDANGDYLYGTPGAATGAIWTNTAPANIVEKTKALDSGQLKIQSGTDSKTNISLYFRQISLKTIGLEDVNLGSAKGASQALTDIDSALSDLLQYRAEIGAYNNRMAVANQALDDATVNMSSYLSTIRDTDVAYEMSFYSNQNIKMQAAMSVLAQANQRPQQILSLLN